MIRRVKNTAALIPARKFVITSAAAIALTAAPSAALAGTASPATAGSAVINASTSQPAVTNFPNHCANDVCAHVTSISVSANTVHVRVWARNYGFFGHFELKVCGVGHNSGKDTGWHAGGRGHTFKVGFRPSCKYIATAWQSAGHLQWNNIGQVTFRVHASG